MSVLAREDPSTGEIRLANEQLALTFVRSAEGFAEILIDAVDDEGQAHRLGIASPFSKIIYRSRRNFGYSALISPKSATIEDLDGDGRRVRFAETLTDVDGVRWRFAFTFDLRPGEAHVSTTYRVTVDENCQLVLFQGPTLRAGEGSFGAAKDVAILPGLEFLEGEEESGSPRDFGMTSNWGRAIPHPNRVTVPLAAVFLGGHVLGLEWDPHFRWDGEHDRLSVRFASPNWLERERRTSFRQTQHLMGVFVPAADRFLNTTPDELDQRSFGHNAATPYRLSPWKPLAIEARILGGANVDLPEFFRRWFARHGVPPAPPLPRSLDESLDLGLAAYTDTWWDEAKQAWIGFHRRPDQAHLSRNRPPMAGAEFLLRAAWRAKDPARAAELRRRSAEVVRRAAQQVEAGTFDEDVAPEYRIFSLNYALRVGGVRAFLAHARHSVDYWIERQKTDGSWRYADERHFTPDHVGLGPADATSLGTCAPYANYLLRFARITGDQRARAAGFKGLAFVEAAGFQVPRGANTWEVPFYAPDQLAAYWAIEMYLEAHRLTGERRFLDRAVYWGATGLPFTYLWSAPGRPIMRYGTIPVFGATWYRESWLGQIVQWIGLDYAHALLHLADYDASLPWRQIAEGITICGTQQMDEDGPYQGGYTDAVNVVSGAVSPFWMPPRHILRNVYALLGEDPVPSTAILGQEQPRVHLTSGAKVLAAERGSDGAISARLGYRPGETSYTLITRAEPPRRVTVNERPLSEVADVDEASEGWQFFGSEGLLGVKTRHDAETVLVVR